MPYGYRQDPTVPAFDDSRPIIVFDGYCAFCTGWARFVMQHDKRMHFRLLTAQSPLGQALYAYFGFGSQDYETNILVSDGVGWFKSEGTIRMAMELGIPWSLAGVFRIVPVAIRDRVYELVARNRMRIAGRRAQCFVPDERQRSRFLT